MNNLKNVYLSGIKVKDLISRYNLKLSDLKSIYLLKPRLTKSSEYKFIT